MSIQEQKLLSTPDNDQSSAVTLHLPQYGGAVGGLSRQIPTGPILGDPADVRQGILGAPADHPLVRPTGLPIPATSLPPYPQPRQQMANPSAQTYHRPGTPSWNTQQYPQSTPTPTPRYPTPAGMTPIPQSITSTPWYATTNRWASYTPTGKRRHLTTVSTFQPITTLICWTLSPRPHPHASPSRSGCSMVPLFVHSSWHYPDTTWLLGKILEETLKLEVTRAR